jgi:hypothetical protein
MRYAVTHYKNGKAITNMFATLKQAKSCANRIFIATGIIVGIEEMPKGKGNA